MTRQEFKNPLPKFQYRSPKDVDVYTGALSEPPMKGAIFGPLLACMVADQFMRLKKGDAFWYERKMGPQKFTKGKIIFHPL